LAVSESLIRINGVDFPDATFRLEIHPVRRLVLSQPFPAPLSFGRFVDMSPEAQGSNIVTVETRNQSTGAFIFRCTGVVTAFYISHESSIGRVVDKEFLEISCDTIQYKEA